MYCMVSHELQLSPRRSKFDGGELGEEPDEDVGDS